MSRSPDVRGTVSRARGRRWLRRIASTGAIALVATTVAAPRAAHADEPKGETQAVCHIEVPQVTITPGLDATPRTGTGQSAAGATIRCVGTIRGLTVAADPGPVLVSFTYGNGIGSSLLGGDTCLAGSGDGTVSATVPTMTGPPLVLSGPIHFGFLGPLASYYGHFGEILFAGIGEPLPDLSNATGNCLSGPMTEFSVRGQLGLKSI